MSVNATIKCSLSWSIKSQVDVISVHLYFFFFALYILLVIGCIGYKLLGYSVLLLLQFAFNYLRWGAKPKDVVPLVLPVVLRWKWTFCHLLSRLCHTRVSSDWCVCDWPSLCAMRHKKSHKWIVHRKLAFKLIVIRRILFVVELKSKRRRLFLAPAELRARKNCVVVVCFIINIMFCFYFSVRQAKSSHWWKWEKEVQRKKKIRTWENRTEIRKWHKIIVDVVNGKLWSHKHTCARVNRSTQTDG